MSRMLTVLLMLTLAATANAVTLSNHQVRPDKATYQGDNMSDIREGGETFATATWIGSLPFNDTGATCDNANDIEHNCGGTGGPDVVYSFVAECDNLVTVSLCGSTYDTLLGVFDASFTEIACNDDYCDLQSQVVFLETAGQTYYIVVDGYISSSCGSYTLSVFDFCHDYPPIDCEAGSQIENEPPCGDDYVDTYNGGCNSTPYVFQLVCPQDGSTAVMCGKSGCYLYSGYSYRDTDWFQIWGDGTQMTATCQAVFPVMLAFMYNCNPTCTDFTYDYILGEPNEPVSLTHPNTLGCYYWVFVAPSQFIGIPCESDYVLQLQGIFAGTGCEPSPVEHKSWGAIKNLYK